IYDVEFQHDIAATARQTLIWGFGYRGARDDVHNAPGIAFLPPDRNLHWTHGLIADTIALDADALRLTAGVRVSANTYTGVEVMPTARLAWKPAAQHMIW